MEKELEQQSESTRAQEESQAISRMLIIELEDFVISRRKVLFETIGSLLKDQGITFSEPAFSRFCLNRDLETAVADVKAGLNADKLDPKKFLEEVQSAIDYFYASDDIAAEDGLVEVVNECREHGMTTGVITGLKEEAARKILKKTGLDGEDIKIFSYHGEGKSFPGADVWLRAAKSFKTLPVSCLSMISSSAAFHAALTSGMKCIAVPDVFTSFQDYSGTVALLDSLRELNLKDVLKLAFN